MLQSPDDFERVKNTEEQFIKEHININSVVQMQTGNPKQKGKPNFVGREKEKYKYWESL